MAYFSNSTEGYMLMVQCDECPIPNDGPCPIFLAQTTYNYDQCKEGQELLRQCLNNLVSEDGKCQMKPILDKICK